MPTKPKQPAKLTPRDRKLKKLGNAVAAKATRLHNRTRLLQSDPLSKRYRSGVSATMEEMAALLADLERAEKEAP